MMEMGNRIGIVVVTYNRLLLLKEVVSALRCQTLRNFQIIVVNNGSTDDTLDWLASQEDVVVITQDNLGGAGGFYTGMKYVAENCYDYCWIMDDDVVCGDNALEELMKAICIDENIGFVCSRVCGINGNPMNTPEPFLGGGGAYSDIYDKVSDYSMVRIRCSTFVSVLFRTSIIHEVGLPYKDYFIWGDDTEYTLRISRKHPCYVACKSVVVHKRKIQKDILFENETDPKRLTFFYYMFRNQAHYMNIEKNKKNSVLYYIRSLKQIVTTVFHGHFSHAYLLLKATWDSFFFHPKIDFPTRSI